MKPYIYRVTHLVTNEYYIGYSEKGATIGVDYFTSSKYVNLTPDNIHEWKIEILEEFDTGMDAFRAEQKLIAEHIEDPACLNKHYIRVDDTTQYRPNYKSEEFIQKQRDAKNKLYESPEGAIVKQKLRAKSLAQKSDPTYAARHRAGTKDAAQKSREQHLDEEWKAEWRKRNEAAQARPETVAKRRASMNTEDYRQQRTNISNSLWANPEYKAKVLAANATPEVKARRSAAQKKGWEARRLKKNIKNLKKVLDKSA